MKINRFMNESKIHLDELFSGDVFIINPDFNVAKVFIKTDLWETDQFGKKILCVDLTTGAYINITANGEVIPVTAELNITKE